MSIMITSSAEDLAVIRSTQAVIKFANLLLSTDNSSIDFDSISFSKKDLSELESYYQYIYNVLTTSGMTYSDYKDSLSNIE